MVIPLTRKSINKHLKESESYSKIDYDLLPGNNYDIKKIPIGESESEDQFIKRRQKECEKDPECMGFSIEKDVKGQKIAILKKERGIARLTKNSSSSSGNKFYSKKSPLLFEIIKVLEILFFKNVMQDEQFSEFREEIKTISKKREQFDALKNLFISLSNKNYEQEGKKWITILILSIID